MPRLCQRCSELYISDSEVQEIRAKLKHDPSSTVVSHFLRNVHSREQDRMTLEQLTKSAEGIDGKRCHLCTLQLHSLRGIDVDASFTQGRDTPNILMELRFTGDEIALLAIRKGIAGDPLQINLNGDDTCRGAEVSASASSRQVISTIRYWVDGCHHHSRCPKSLLSYLPTRVIDVGTGLNQKTVRLCETRGLAGIYITLSHRWSENTAVSSTTCSNYEIRKSGFDMANLSKTFQDAIETARALEVRYLWIDSICIIQDSEEDWKRESSNMMSVYESAWLNIAAAGSSKSDGRLFMPRDQFLNMPCRLPGGFSTLDDSGTERYQGEPHVFVPPSLSAKEVLDSFLDSRAWVMQERILSRRTIYFGENEVFWECSEHVASESVPWGFGSDTDVVPNKFYCLLESTGFGTQAGAVLERRYSNIDIFGQSLKPTSHELQLKAPYHSEYLRIYQYWCRLVEKYSSKDVTNQSDKLPAIHGLAQALHNSKLPQKSFVDSYFQGLWLDDLAHSLLWICKTPNSDDLAHASSFSWASCSGMVNFAPCSLVPIACDDDGQKNTVLSPTLERPTDFHDYTKNWQRTTHSGRYAFEMYPNLVNADSKFFGAPSSPSTVVWDDFRHDPTTKKGARRRNSYCVEVLKTGTFEMGLLVARCDGVPEWENDVVVRRIGIYKAILNDDYGPSKPARRSVKVFLV